MLQALTRCIAGLALVVTVPLQAQEPRRLALEEALRLFGLHSPALRAARADGAALVGRAVSVGVAANPTLGLTREAVSDGDRSSGETYLTISQALRWPRTGSARRAATRQAQVAVAARFTADSLDLAHAVKQAFAEAWLAEQRQLVVRRLASLVVQLDQRGRDRFAGGDLSGFDLRRLVLERIRYDRLASAGDLAVDAARRVLGAVVLDPESQAAVAPADFPAPPFAGGPWTGDTAQALRNHPVLSAARSELLLAQAEEGAELALRWPSPSLTAAYKRQDDGMNGVLLGAAVPMAFFDRRAGPQQVATAGVRAAEARLAIAERSVGDRLRHALARHGAAARQAATFEAAGQGRGEDLLAIALVAYEEGELGLLDLLATVEAWRELGTLAAQVRAEYWLSRFELELALGGSLTMTSADGQEAR